MAALAEVLKVEYEKIAEAGLILQVDCPDLAMGRHILFRDVDTAAFKKAAWAQVEALNYALENVPADRARAASVLGQLRGTAPPRCRPR